MTFAQWSLRETSDGWHLAVGALLAPFALLNFAKDRYSSVVGGVLLSPYSMPYDLAGLTVVAVAMLLSSKRSPVNWIAAALILTSVLATIGRGEEQAAQELLETPLLENARRGQFGQLPLAENPTKEEDEEDEIDVPERRWTDDSTGEKVWKTSFPPPAGFDGYEKYKWDAWG